MARILLTNDDGITSPGLASIALELLRAGGHELTLIAPDTQQSGVGHGITLHRPVFVEEVKLPDELGSLPAYQVTGTPADCVKLALTAIMKGEPPDLVVSGINSGLNYATISIYSGTVAGAREACLNDISAIALSLDSPSDGLWRFPLAAELSLPVVQEALEWGLPKGTLLNVNIPSLPASKIRGYRLARQGLSRFDEWFEEEPREGTRRKFRIEGSFLLTDTDPTTDVIALRDGYVAVCPLGLRSPPEDSVSSEGRSPSMGEWRIFG